MISLLLSLSCSSSFYSRVVMQGEEAGQNLGKRPAAAGDVDGDGIGDLAVRDVRGSLVFSGQIFLAEEPPTVEQAMARLPLPEGLSFSQTSEQIGEVISLGDLDGDGLSEVVDGIGCKDLALCGGAAHVVVYSGASIAAGSPQALWSRTYDNPEVLALSVGNTDGDALPDLAIATRAQASVISGSVLAAGSSAPLEPIEGPNADVELVDLDGDGLDELALAQPDASGGGRVRIYRWTGTARRPAPLQTLIGPEGAWFGTKLVGLDLDHDGMQDLIISGAESASAELPEMLWQVRGRSLDLLGTRIELDDFETDGGKLRYTPLERDTLRGNIGIFGHSLDACTDLDGDGLEDLLFAARPSTKRWLPTNTDGHIYGMSVASTDAVFEIWQHSPRDGWLLYVACVGDLDQDGLEDVLVGTPSSRRGELEGAGQLWLLRTGIGP